MLVLRCKTHPRYKAIKEPTKSNCDQCWHLWALILTLPSLKELIKR